MFKNIPGSHNLTISLNNQIRNNDGSLPNLSINNNIVEIELYGIKISSLMFQQQEKF